MQELTERMIAASTSLQKTSRDMAEAFAMADGQARLLAAQLAEKDNPQSDGLIARRLKTVGRNDPCPNHTDVKFKNCECYHTLKTRALIPYRVARQMQGAKKK